MGDVNTMIADPGQIRSKKNGDHTKLTYNPASRIGGWNASPVSQGK
jgi:hypothetical protein